MEPKLSMRDSSGNTNRRSSIAGDVPSRFCDGFDDPIFLEESWTLGPAAAVDRLHGRRDAKAERESQAHRFRALEQVETLRFIEDREPAAASALEDRAAAIVDRYDAGSTQSWSPRTWLPEDRIAQSWIPQGWTPSYMPHLGPPAATTEWSNGRMTSQCARQLLEVTAASTREQVRSAYRRMVGQWHPDRLQYTTDAIRNHATEHMAALNQAYRLLSATELQEAA